MTVHDMKMANATPEQAAGLWGALSTLKQLTRVEMKAADFAVEDPSFVEAINLMTRLRSEISCHWMQKRTQ
jgi:hypothetical protein